MRELFEGPRFLLRGFGFVAARGRLFALGAVPPLISSVLLTGIIVVLGFQIEPIAVWLTPWASGWDAGWVAVFRGFVAALVLVSATLLLVLSFTALTLALGAPIYERISLAVEAACGGVPGTVNESGLASSMRRGLVQALATIALSLCVAAALFAIGFVPLVGTAVSAVASATFGGWLIARDLIGPALERRGRVTLREKSAAVNSRRWLALGFGVPAFLLLSIPFVAVLVFPGATAGGTLLARRILGEPTVGSNNQPR